MKPPKPKKCACCPQTFIPRTSLQKVCSVSCSIVHAERTRKRKEALSAKIDRKVTREKKEKLKTRSDWIKETQIAFNKFTRLRDADDGCISCGARYDNSTMGVGGTFDAGHYLSRGSHPHLRFDERNCHAQCKRCNRYLSSNHASYRDGLIARIGLAEVETLERDKTPRHYTIDQLKELKKHYAMKCRELMKLRESAC